MIARTIQRWWNWLGDWSRWYIQILSPSNRQWKKRDQRRKVPLPGALHMRRIRLAAAELPGHGCVFFELCARLPAFKIERIASSDRGSSVNWRTARLVRMNSETVMLEYLPPGCNQRSKRKPIPL